MKKFILISILFLATLGCESTQEFKVITEQFADLRILRYQVPGFDELSPQQKELAYYLYQAGLSGRDICWDQNYKYNLTVRRTLEEIVKHYDGDRNSDDFNNFMVYTKRVWFSSGIHHHYSTAKIMPDFSSEYFAELVSNTDGVFPVSDGESVEQLVARLTPIIFDPTVAAKAVNLAKGVDHVAESANNYYEGVTADEVAAFYDGKRDPNDPEPISYGLNSKLVKEDGHLVEKVWKVGGMYGPALEKIIYWLNKAVDVAENDKQQRALALLAEYFQTGNLKTFDKYSIAWVEDTESDFDLILGFIEVYGDAIGYRGAFESVLELKDKEATKRIDAIGAEAQWFEDNSTIMDEHKKEDVTGILANVVTVIGEVGATSPSSPIGINLPNANWIRAKHGSKSVTLGNIVDTYNAASAGDGFLEEFAYSEEEVDLAKKWGVLSGNLHTDMHEVIGHASGKLNPGVGTTKETLKSYASALEEGRADLVALYFIMDQKLVDIGVIPTLDVGKDEYNGYITNGLMTQLRRLELGDDVEESHMRNRQMVAKWAYEKGKADNVIERKKKDGKTYFVINDYEKLRDLFGQLLREIQRIKSEGDYESGAELIETYGVKVDQELHKEVLERFGKLNIAPYSGFINARLVPVERDGKIVDVKIEYPDDFTAQMLEYAENYSFLPNEN